MKKLHACTAAVVVGAFTWIAQANAEPVSAVEISNISAFNPPFSAVVGWEFVANSDITVTSLGMWDEFEDGFNNDAPEVGLWTLNGDLLASTIVTSNDELIDGFRYSDISDVKLTGDTHYVVAGVFREVVANTNPNSFAFDADISNVYPTDVMWLDSRGANSDTLIFPTDFNNFDGFFGANFRFVDEPTTCLLIITGLLGLGMTTTQRRAKLIKQ
ncbi:MAG: DUF4082 domain-containing protein [Gammaproteobacteria bacterium]